MNFSIKKKLLEFIYINESVEKMSKTQIFTSRKLEKTIKASIGKKEEESTDYLGSWVATIFHVSHKKCWILINSKTKYVLVFPNIRKNDLESLSSLFTEAFYAELIYDGIIVDYSLIEKIIGAVSLFETNNDRSSIGILNYCLEYLEMWKNQYQVFENMPFRELNNRLNNIPYTFLKLKFPKEEMSQILRTF